MYVKLSTEKKIVLSYKPTVRVYNRVWKTLNYSCAIITVTIWRRIFLSVLPKSKILNHRRLWSTKLFVVLLWTSSNQHWQQEACIVNDCRCAKKASFSWNHSETRGRSTWVSWLCHSFIIYLHSMLQHSSL